MIKKIIIRFLSNLYRLTFTDAGRGTFVSYLAEIRGSNIKIGENCKILKYARLDTSSNPSNGDYLKSTSVGKVMIGNSVKIKEYSMLLSYDGFISIGDSCTINPFTIIYGSGGVRVGNNVMIAAHCVIVSSSHIFDSIELPINMQGITSKGITIGNDVWIGSNVKILDGVEIGDGCVIAAGSVVNKSLPPFGIYGGVPVKLLKNRINSN